MSLNERFTAGMGTILGLQAVPISGITTLDIVDMKISQNNVAPERVGTVLLSIDGVVYTVRFTLTDESFDQRTLQGATKRRNPRARIK